MNFFETENLKSRGCVENMESFTAKERTNPLTKVREEAACALERTFDPLGFGSKAATTIGNADRVGT
jgi:hypothetical protein